MVAEAPFARLVREWAEAEGETLSDAEVDRRADYLRRAFSPSSCSSLDGLLDRAAASVLERQRLRDGSRSYVLMPAPGVLVDVERALVERVIENMVVNAAKYAHAGRTIRVLVASEEGSGTVRVLDEGPGVDAQDMDSVFEPFYRASTTRDRASGAGLGLAVSKRIVELLDGTIWARQHASGGAEFGFTLPLLDDEAGV